MPDDVMRFTRVTPALTLTPDEMLTLFRQSRDKYDRASTKQQREAAATEAIAIAAMLDRHLSKGGDLPTDWYAAC